MRQILVDHARRRGAAKRGGKWLRVTLGQAVDSGNQRDVDLLSLDEALTELAALDPRKSEVVELRFFGGMTTQDRRGRLVHGAGLVEPSAERR